MPSAPAGEIRAVRALLFTVSGLPFAIEVGHAREVVVFEGWTPIPGAPAHLVGIANLRGYVIPILTIQEILGLAPATIGRQLRALVVTQPSGAIALAIEGTPGLESFEEVVPCGVSARQEYGEFARGLLPWEGRMVPLLDVPRLVAALKVAARPA